MIKKGKLISFIGVDGSGKTTQSRELLDVLCKNGKKAIRIKRFSFFFLVLPLKALKKFMPVRNNLLVEGEKVDYHRKNILKEKFPFLATVDCWFNYLFTVFPLLFKYDYVITDRYFYDYGPNLLRLGIGSNQTVLWFLKHLPKPDFCFYLKLSAEKAVKRKQEFRLPYLKKLVVLYNQLFHDFDGIIEKQADLEIKVLNGQIIKEVLS